MPASIQRFYIIEGSLTPALEMVVTRESTGLPYDFTGHTSALFSMRKIGAVTSKVQDASASFVSPTTAGTLRHDWSALEVDEPGVYKGQFSCSDSATNPVRMPNDAYIEIHILPRLNK